MPVAVRQWIETRRASDLDKLDKALEFYDRMGPQEAQLKEALQYIAKVRDRGKFFMWLVTGTLTIMFSFATFSDHIIRLLNYIRGGRP